MLKARLDDRDKALLDRRTLLGMLGSRILHRVAMLMKHEQPGIDADLVNVPRSLDSNRGALMVNIRRQRNVAVLFRDFGSNLPHRLGFAERGSCDAHQLAPRLMKLDDLVDASLDVSRFGGDHRLNNDRMSTP